MISQESEVIDFLGVLLCYIPGPLLIVWDRLSAHRSKRTRDFINGRASAYGWDTSLAMPRNCLLEELVESGRDGAPNAEKNAVRSAP